MSFPSDHITIFRYLFYWENRRNIILIVFWSIIMSFWLCNLLEFFFCWSQISFSKIGSKLLKLVKQISNIKLCSKFCWLAGLRVPHLNSDDFVTNFYRTLNLNFHRFFFIVLKRRKSLAKKVRKVQDHKHNSGFLIQWKKLYSFSFSFAWQLFL